MTQIIIGLIGKNCSGKSDAAAYLSSKYRSASTYSFSQALRLVLRDLNIEESRQNLLQYSEVLRRHFGQDLLSNLIMKKVNNDRSDLIIIEGIRRTYDLAAFQFLPNFSLIALQADPEIRYQRLLARNQNHGDQLKTYDEFLVDQESEPEREIDKVISSAKYIIRNDGSIQELYQQLNLKLEIIFAH